MRSPIYLPIRKAAEHMYGPICKDLALFHLSSIKIMNEDTVKKNNDSYENELIINLFIY